MDYKPDFPYLGDQIIINSGRVTLNSKEDSVFIFGKNAIGLSSAGTINFDSDDKFIVNSPKIYLGLEAKEPLVKGDSLEVVLNDILSSLITLSDNLSYTKDSNGIPLTSVIDASNTLKADIKRVLPKVKKMKSNNNYTL